MRMVSFFKGADQPLFLMYLSFMSCVFIFYFIELYYILFVFIIFFCVVSLLNLLVTEAVFEMTYLLTAYCPVHSAYCLLFFKE